MEIALAIASAVISLIALALLGALIVFWKTRNRETAGNVTSKELKAEGELVLYGVKESVKERTESLAGELGRANGLVLDQMKAITEGNDKRIGELREALGKGLAELNATVREELRRMRDANDTQLEKMREVVDEKLTKTLNDRLTQSFNAVAERLESVYKNLGEISSLSDGMSDLRRMLSNIKTRGTFGEVSLENLLADSLTPAQYEKQCNLSGRGASQERVDFAVVMPGRENGKVYLPIDVKFPEEDFLRIRDAAEQADRGALSSAEKQFEASVLAEGRKIRDKYVKPPVTTDFAVMYLPTESLYGEILKNEKLMQSLYSMRVVPAGPTTFTALLNALRMGFRSFQIQKESVKVFRTFQEISKLMRTFNEQLAKVKENLLRAEKNLDDVSQKSGKIETKLMKIDYPDEIAGEVAADAEADGAEEDR